MTDYVVLNYKTIKELEKLYAEAVAAGKDSFLFQGKEILTQYAKYLLQYIMLGGN